MRQRTVQNLDGQKGGVSKHFEGLKITTKNQLSSIYSILIRIKHNIFVQNHGLGLARSPISVSV